MAETMQEKTEPATDQRRQDARKEGDVARSAEIPSIFVLLGGVYAVKIFGKYMYGNMVAVMRDCLAFTHVPDFTAKQCVSLFYKYSLNFFLTFSPVMVTVLIMALVTNIYMVGFQITWNVLEFKFDKLNPINGIIGRFSLTSVVELLKSIVKLTIIGLLAWLAVRGQKDKINSLYDGSIGAMLVYLMKMIYKIFIWVISPMACMAILDYLFQKWNYEKKLKMTKQEVKDEFKQKEGDPQIKGRIRSLQMEAAKKRMMAQVPMADVIVTNPTHIAVAIQYNPLEMKAPKVVAKGAGLIAEKIREIGKESDVPIVENKELARNLYKTVDIGSEIPGDFYRAVAEILAYVYRLKGKRL